MLVTVAPRRRGRPPGSRNKPKADTIAIEVIPSVESVTSGHGVPAVTRLVIRFKSGLSANPEIRETILPLGWPLPQINDVVRLGGLVGRAQYTEYDYETGTVTITAV